MTTTPEVQVPAVEDIAAALSKTVAEVQRAYDAEVSDQTSRCRVEPYTGALADALHRRVARNMAMRNLPLGVQLSGEIAIRVGGLDGEVRRLEGPYRRLMLG